MPYKYIALISIAILTCCSKEPRYISNWSKIKIGMDESEVRLLLGEPTSSQMPSEGINEGNDSPVGLSASFGLAMLFFGPDRYEYYDKNSPMPSDFSLYDLFREQDNAYVVYFDINKKVMNTRTPIINNKADNKSASADGGASAPSRR